jgi:ATP-binding cassette subfamily C protein/ATP-binding cassette subfamily C protein LapB
MLARAWVRRAPVYLLDNPGQNLDRAGDEALVRKLASLKGSATVLFTTYRPSHMRLADRLVVLEQGQVAAEGAPDAVLAKMSAA